MRVFVALAMVLGLPILLNGDETLVYEFSGELPNNSSNHPQVQDGESWTARFTIDPTILDELPGDPMFGVYTGSVTSATLAFSGGFSQQFDTQGWVALVSNDRDIATGDFIDAISVRDDRFNRQILNVQAHRESTTIPINTLADDGLQGANIAFASQSTTTVNYYQLQFWDPNTGDFIGYQANREVNTTFASYRADSQVLIPIPDIAKHVFDHTRNHLLVSTANGQVHRYDVLNRTELTPFAVGINLSGGIDITDDGAFAYVGERVAGATQGIVRKVDLNTGSRTNLFYDLTSSELGVWELHITNNNKAFFTVAASGSSSTKIREIDLATDLMTIRGNVTQWTGIARGPDRSILFFQQGNISSGPILTYSAVTDDFPTFRHTNMFVGSLPAAVSRDGSLIAFKNSLLSSETLNLVELIPEGARGYVFDPVEDILYMTASNEIVVYSVPNISELARFPIGEVGSKISTNSTGSLIFVTTASGVRVISNPLAVATYIPEAFNIARGILSGGDLSSLAQSDNVDLSAKRNPADVQSRVFLEVKSTSPSETPTHFEFVFEASVFARTTVVQSIELYNYDADDWELVDTRNAQTFTDLVTTVIPSVNYSRFVQPGTRCVEARIRFQSVSSRQRFTANIDRAVWKIAH